MTAPTTGTDSKPILRLYNKTCASVRPCVYACAYVRACVPLARVSHRGTEIGVETVAVAGENYGILRGRCNNYLYIRRT